MNTNTGRLRRALTAGLVAATTVATPIAVGAEPAEGLFYTVDEDSNLNSLDNFFDVLLDDATGPFGPTSIASYTQGAKGSVGAVLSAENDILRLTYIPDPDVFGTDVFDYTVELDDGSFQTQTVTVSVTPSQDAPVAVADDLTDIVIVENGDPVDILAAVLANDTDVDEDAFSITAINTEGTHGTVVLTPASEEVPATLTYEATSDSATSDSFTYTVTDIAGNASTAGRVNLTIVPVDDAPVAVADGDDEPIALDEDGSVLIEVVRNDTDVDGPAITIDPESITEPSNGTAVLEDNQIRYTPAQDFSGEDSFTYGVIGGGSATVSLVINATDDPPVAVDDGVEFPHVTIPEGGTVTLGVLGNDTDVDGGPRYVTDISGVPEAHSASVLPGDGPNAGEITYTHGGNDLSDVLLTYTVNGGSTAGVWLEFSNEDDDPFTVAPVPNVEINEDADGTIISVLTDGQVDVDGTELVLAAIGSSEDGPSLGAAELVDIDGASTLVYTPNKDANGQDTFSVVVSDGNEDHEVAVLITVDITAANDAPVALGDDYTNESVNEALGDSVTTVLVLEDTTTFLPLLDNDSDIDNNALAVDLTHTDLDPEVGTLEVVDGGVNFTPAPNFFGEVSFDYQAIEIDAETPLASESVTVNVVVVAQPDNVDAGDDEADVREDTEVYLSVTKNDIDHDGFDLEIVSATQPENGYIVVIGNEIRVEPDTNFHGEMEFTYTVKPSARIEYSDAGVVEIPCDDEADCATTTATVTVTVTPMNDVPVAKADNGIETDEDVAISIDVLGNDSDIDEDDLSIRFLGTPSLGTVAVVDGEVLYTPNENVSGTDSFTYNAFDGFALATSSVSITINAVNDAPTIESVETTGSEDTDVVLELTVNDVEPDNQALSVSVGEVTGGSASVEGTTLTFTPAENFVGTALVPVTVTDDDNLQGQAVVTIEVAAVNDAPVIDDERAETSEDEAVSIDMSFSDVEDESLTLEIDEAPANGTAEIIEGNVVLYTPADDFNGEDTFTVTTADSEGAEATATVTVDVASINDIPVIANEEASTDEDTPVTIPMTFSDIEDDDLEIEIGFGFLPRFAAVQIDGLFEEEIYYYFGGYPMHGSAEIDGNNVIYTPDENFYGEDSFMVTTIDSYGALATATVTVTVASVNDAPVISDATVETDEDESVLIPISVTDVEDGPFLFEDDDYHDEYLEVPRRLSLVESFEESADITITDGPTSGTAEVGPGGVVYTPAEDFNGQDSFTVSTTDSDGATSTATITVNVAPVNDKPDIDDADASTDEDSSVTIPMTFSDDEDDLIIEIGEGPSNGTAVIDGENVIYTPADNFYGEDTFTVTTHDSERKLGKADVTVAVGSVNDLPLIDDNSASTDKGEAVSVPMSFSDIEDDSLTIEIGESPRYGTAVADNGNVVYTPADDFSGEDSFTVTTTDSNGATATATVTVTVTAEEVVVVNPYIGADAIDGQVVRIYSAMLGRTPDAGGFAFWVDARNSGMSLARMIEMFADSPEFKATFGNRMDEDTNEEWVDFVYVQIMGRTPDAGGRAFWLNMLETGQATRSWMVVAFAESPEFQTLTQTS